MSIELTEELINKSLVSKGNVDRILKLYEKINKGEDIVVAFLGGSITQGCNSSVYEKCYVELVAKWFADRFKNVNVSHINAGVGATGSLIGVHRADKQVLSKKPDIIFVDAAVNDDKSQLCRISYESEIRKLLSSKGSPAVIEVFMTEENGVNCQEQQIEIGRQYNLPMISFRNTALELVEKHNLKWSDLLTDEVHPNDDGHEIITRLLTNLLERVYEEDYVPGREIKIEDHTLEIPCVYGDRYINGRILNNKDLVPLEISGFKEFAEGFQVFDDGWKFEQHKAQHEEGRLVLEVRAKNVILLYKEIISEKAGCFEVSVNGQRKDTIDTYFKDGWGDRTVTKVLEQSDEMKDYKIEIKVDEEQSPREVTILGIMVS